jgi:ferredoxin
LSARWLTERQSSALTCEQAMQSLRQRARELLESGQVNVVIGFEECSGDRVRPLFARKPQEVERLVLDDRCRLNPAVYLSKPEVKALGKPLLVASDPVLRSVLQLSSENHFSAGDAIILARSSSGEVVELTTPGQIAEFLDGSFASCGQSYPVNISDLPIDERWEFWQREFSRCMKCYACRAACPMCYCQQCLVECNQPQWVPVAPHLLGNFEWHVSRAMHLAGRCVDCGACSEACPVGIPLFLINRFLSQLLEKEFNQRAGISATVEYPLAVYSASDREGFIK